MIVDSTDASSETRGKLSLHVKEHGRHESASKLLRPGSTQASSGRGVNLLFTSDQTNHCPSSYHSTKHHIANMSVRIASSSSVLQLTIDVRTDFRASAQTRRTSKHAAHSSTLCTSLQSLYQRSSLSTLQARYCFLLPSELLSASLPDVCESSKSR